MHATTLFATLTLLSAALINAYDPVKMLCLVNKQRTSNGLKPLGMSQQLENASKEHSEDQARMGSMTHDGSDGSSPGDRVERAGYNWRSVAENVAYGYGDEEECMKEWMNSAGHRENILGRDYTHFGSAAAYAGSTPYYTQDFGGDGQSHSFPECPSGGSYGDSGGDSGGSNGGSDNYGDSAPSSSGNYGGSAPSSSGNYGGSAPSSSGNYGGSAPSSSHHGSSKPSKSYGGNKSPSNSYSSSPSYGAKSPSKSRGGRKMTAYGGNVSDSNDRKPSRDSNNNNKKKPAYGGNVNYSNNSSKPSYGNKKPAHRHRHSRRHSQGGYGSGGHSHGGHSNGGQSSGGY